MEYLKTNVDFFLGAVGPGGFRSYFSDLEAQPGRKLYLLKAGPGCGKSTLMRRIAASSPLPVERIHCSSDPDSLDGVILQAPSAAVLDATAPHVLEPAYPGAVQQVVDLYHTMDPQRLRQERLQIIALFRRCKSLQERAAQYISTAAGLLQDSRRTALATLDEQKMRAYAARLAMRYLPSTDREGREEVRLLSAVTPKGRLVFFNTIEALAKDKVVFHDQYGGAAPLLLAMLRRHALERGYHVITCRCPLQQDAVDHLFIPERNLAFLTSNHWHTMAFDGQKNIHCTRFAPKDALRGRKKRLRFNQRAAQELLDQASEAQRQAKASHDELEQYYQNAVDFQEVDKMGDRLVETLFGSR